jgi:Spy/CpxP family protein refolding chaperone
LQISKKKRKKSSKILKITKNIEKIKIDLISKIKYFLKNEKSGDTILKISAKTLLILLCSLQNCLFKGSRKTFSLRKKSIKIQKTRNLRVTATRNLIFAKVSLFIILYMSFVSLVYGESQPKQEGNPQVQPKVQPQAQPMTQSQVQRRTILDFKEGLKLTREQEEKIKRIIEGFQKKKRDLTERMRVLDGEIRKLLEENGEMREIEKKVKELFQLRAQVVIEDIKAGREIDKVLNVEQREKWRKIKRGERP